MISEKIGKWLYWPSVLLCVLVGFAYSDSPDILRTLFDSVAVFLGIIASVSLALSALMLQTYERLVDGEDIDAYKKYEVWFKKNLKKERTRIAIAVFPIIAGMPFQLNILAANGFYIGFLFFSLSLAVISSVMLPVAFYCMIKNHADLIFQKGRERKKRHNKEIASRVGSDLEELRREERNKPASEILESSILHCNS